MDTNHRWMQGDYVLVPEEHIAELEITRESDRWTPKLGWGRVRVVQVTMEPVPGGTWYLLVARPDSVWETEQVKVIAVGQLCEVELEQASNLQFA